MTRFLHPFAVLAAAAALAACSAQPVSAAGAGDDAAPRTITVTGHGEAAQAPDMALITIGVQSNAKSAGEAMTANSRNMKSVIEQLKAAGLASKDVQTASVSLSPVYDYGANGRRGEVTGYQASNQVTARVRDLSKLGGVLDTVVKSGANTIDNLSFTFADPKPLQDAARKNAVADAMDKAKLYANAAGVALGPVMTLTEGGDYQPRPYAKSMARLEAAPVPIEAGETSIAASVNIVFAIK